MTTSASRGSVDGDVLEVVLAGARDDDLRWRAAPLHYRSEQTFPGAWPSSAGKLRDFAASRVRPLVPRV